VSVPLAAVADVEARLGRQVTDTEAERIDRLLVDASAAVRNYTGRTFTQEAIVYRTRVDMRNGRLRLPQRPVVAVTSVHAMNLDGTVGGALSAWMFDGIDTLTLASPGLVINATTPDCDQQVVQIAYTAGYDDVPDDIVAVVCSITARAFGVPPDETAIQQESIVGYSTTLGSVGAAGPVGMLNDERAILDRYRLPVGPIRTSRW
jgi:hypothetical protein